MLDITVFTPTYNRAELLGRLYESLQKQTFFGFEWIIIDDGSTDATEKVVSKWLAEDNKFDIIYQKQPNGGKHRAINKGIELAKGRLFFIVDSDDFLRKDAIEKILYYESTIKNKDAFAGVCGLRCYTNGNLIGTTFSSGFFDITSAERSKAGISGDKSEVFYTEIMKSFLFPEIEDEKFVPEALVWNRISYAGYKLRYFNEGIYYCDYQPNGLSSKIDKLLINNFKAYELYVIEMVESSIVSNKDKLSSVINYCRRAKKNGLSYGDIGKRVHISRMTAVVYNILASTIYFIRGIRK